jgi:beta-glucanase (GH16 family)
MALAALLACGPDEAAHQDEPAAMGDAAEPTDAGTADLAPREHVAAAERPVPARAPAEGCALAGPPTASGSVLVWGDEFDGEALDTSRWDVMKNYVAPDVGTNSTDPSCVEVKDGVLRITTRAAPEDPDHPFVSGRIDSHARFVRTYGRAEMRARFPYAPGLWYAMWARPWDSAMPEIDVELLSRKGMQLYFVNHWALPPIPADQRRIYTVQTFDFRAFHVYTVIWRPGSLEWQVDGKTGMTSTGKGVPHDPIGWIINGWVGGWGGPMTAETKLPATFEVDYIRVYRDEGMLADPAIRVRSVRRGAIDVQPANFDEACFHVHMYDGETWIATRTAPPWSFATTELAPGPHTLRFEATDGVRRAEVTLATETN